MWQSDQRAMSTADLTDTEMALINQAEVPAEHDYDYEEDPDLQTAGGDAAGEEVGVRCCRSDKRKTERKLFVGQTDITDILAIGVSTLRLQVRLNC